MGEIWLSDVVSDPMLAEAYTIKRSTGTFQLGGWVQTAVTINGYGVVSVASDEDLVMIAEGDRVSGAMVFHSVARIFLTQLDGGYGQGGEGEGGYGVTTQRVSDQINWRDQTYRILHVSPYPNRGYWKAIGVRMAGR